MSNVADVVTPASTASVTVVIPTYNRARYIGAAIESALAQTLSAAEVIVVDDGSTDGTRDVVARYGSRIRYHHQPNRGVGAARNAGISLASSRYIALLDSDDCWHPHKLELQVALLEALPDVALLHTEFEILKESDGTRIPRGSRTWLGHSIDLATFYDRRTTCRDLGITVSGVAAQTPVLVGDTYRTMVHEMLVLTSTVMFRRAVVAAEGLRFPEEGVVIFEDWEFYARIARRHAVAFADVETTINRGHSGAERLTRLPRLGKVQQYLNLLERVWKADPEFMTRHGDELRHVEARTLVALAREGVLASRPDVAHTALARWRSLRTGERAGVAWLCRACAAIPFGGIILRVLLRLLALTRRIFGVEHGDYSVNPAA